MKELRQNVIHITTTCLLLVLILFIAVGFMAGAVEAAVTVSSEESLQTAISNAPANGTLYSIEVTQEINLTAPLVIEPGKNIRIYSGGTEPVSVNSHNQRHFEVQGSLTLSDILLDGGDTGGGVFVDQGTLILNAGAIVTNCNAAGKGGGVYVDGGSVAISGGSIVGNIAQLDGGGLFAANASSVTLSSGSIRENRLDSDYGQGGGGINIADTSTFNMSGGDISDNETYPAGNAASTAGGGVVVNGTFYLTSGTISGNRSTHAGGGVMVTGSGSFQMQGGVISHNTTASNSASVASGGGVSVQAGGVFTMKGGLIEENTGDYGGGVYVGHATNTDTAFYLNGGTIRANTAEYGGGIMGQYAKSVIHITGGTIGGPSPEDANTAEIGGGLFLHQATANLGSGSVIGNYASEHGGGLYAAYGRITMSGGSVKANSAPFAGGIYLSGDNTSSSVLQITGGEVSGNQATTTHGGGIYLTQYVNADISGAVVSSNKAAVNGGGIYLENGSMLPVANTKIMQNTAGNNGGGIFVTAAAELMGGTTLAITGNHAGVEGGGAYTQKFGAYAAVMNPAYDYTNLNLENDTVFSGNTANALYSPPENAGAFTNLGFAGVSLPALSPHPLNNFDINFVLDPAITVYNIIYDANDGTPEPKTVRFPVEPGGSHQVKADTDPAIGFIREGFIFTGWNDQPDGKGAGYAIEFIISDIDVDITLYAQWKADTNLNDADHFAYIVGYPDKTVRPSAGITRAETTTIFFRLLTEETRNAYWSDINSFTDLQKSIWYNVAVSTMADADIISGYKDGTFQGDQWITRAEFATIAARFDSGTYTGSDKFSDIGNHWAKEYINRATEKGWITGYDDGTFRPDSPITRAEAVTLINRVLNREKNLTLHPDMRIWSDNVSGQWYYQNMQEATNSHLYERDDSGYEIWTAVLPPRDWAAIERS